MEGLEIGAHRRNAFSGDVFGHIAPMRADVGEAAGGAVEFGIQPALFHDSSGAPLYAPYPLSISIPAMMIGHLTFAGLAEMIVSAGVVGYIAHHREHVRGFDAARRKLLFVAGVHAIDESAVPIAFVPAPASLQRAPSTKFIASAAVERTLASPSSHSSRP